jgi:hypothetical protein
LNNNDVFSKKNKIPKDSIVALKTALISEVVTGKVDVSTSSTHVLGSTPKIRTA